MGTGMAPPGLQEEGILCGYPVTISQCKFQAYIARVTTAEEAQAVCKSVSEQTERAAALAEYVCPFAYRLAPAGVGGRGSAAQQSDGSSTAAAAPPPLPTAAAAAEASVAPAPAAPAPAAPAPAPTAAAAAVPAVPTPAAAAAAAVSLENGDGEGYCDNGDVGSGEKLLYLLQKWDIRNRVLVVTRINGGFMRAELLGVRRYRFVVDRAKKLLENSELASLRRAVETDINPPTTHQSTTTLTTNDEFIDVNRLCPTPRNSLQEGADAAAAVGDSWDRFVLPLSAQQITAGVCVESGNLLGAPPPPASEGVMSPRRTTASGSRGQGEQGGSVDVKPSSKAKGIEGSCWYLAGEKNGTRERQALSLAQLSISSKTIAFPPGHVPSVLGARGHGKKRGRINHFAVRTPPRTSGGGVAGNGNGNSSRSGTIVGEEKFAPLPDHDSNADAGLQVCATSAWILPHQLDPTSAITDFGASCGENGAGTKGGGKTGGVGSRSSVEQVIECPSNPLLSRASSCATINSPSRVSAIMLGMATGISKDHTLHPPPPAAAAYANRYSLRKGKWAPGALVNSYNGGVDLSFAGSSLGSISCSDTSDEISPIRGGLRRYRQQPSTSVSGCYPNSRGQLRVSPHPPPPAGSGEASASASGYGGTGAGGLLRDGDLLESCSHAFPSGKGGGGSLGGGGGRGGGGGCGGGGGGGGGGSTEDNNNHPGLSLPLLRQTPGPGVRDEPYYNPGGVATELLGSSASVGGWKNDDDRSISTTSGGVESLGLDEPSHFRGGDGGGEGVLADEEEGRQQRQCDSPPWSLGDGATGRTTASGLSDVAGSRGESALRGWTAGRAVPESHRTS